MTCATTKRLAAIALAATCAATGALAQDYPARPITLVVSTAAGGGNDIMARVIGERMSKTLGQQIVVENRPGAGGTIATKQVAKSAPDGYTLTLGNTGTLAQGPAFYANAGYDPRKDFAAIGLVAAAPLAVVVHPAVPANTLQELIELAKKEPGTLTYGSGGAGTPNHLTGVMFEAETGVKLTHVPFRGSGPAVAALLGHHVAMMFAGLPSVIGAVKNGQVRVLATTSVQRAKALPDSVTVAESGFRDFEASRRYGLVAPAGTPQPIIDKLNAALREALTSGEVIAKIAAEGAEPLPSTPAEYAKDIDKEAAKWTKVIEQAGIKPQ